METIERLRNKGVDNYFTTSQKDMDKNLRSMKELAQEYVSIQKQLTDIQRKLRETSDNLYVPKDASKEQADLIERQKQQARDYANIIKQQQKTIQTEYVKTLGRFRQMAYFQQSYSKNFKHIFNSNDLRNLPTDDWERARRIVSSMANDADDATSKLDSIRSKIQEVTKLNRRAESLSRRASASGYMSFQQASNFRQDYFTATNQYKETQKENLDALTKLGQERKNLYDNIKRIELNPFASQQDIDRKIAMQQTVEAIDKEWEARMELNRVLNSTIENMKRYNEAVQGVVQKPERGTLRGMMYERAPAIGLALMGTVGGIAGGLYHTGAGLNRAMRSDEISIGQRTDTAGDQWRSLIRNGAIEAGLQNRLGFSGQEMLAFENNYLSNNGFTNMNDLNSAMVNQAVFSRVTGLSANDTNDFFSTLFSTGAVNGSQVRDIQDAFVGAIKQSGMEGREKAQVKALQGILTSVGQGRTLTNADVMNTMGLQAVLASTGKRSLQGEQGGDLLTGLNQGIQQGFNNPAMRLIFGQGTKYQGLEGRWKLREQMYKGISDVRNVQTLARFAQQYGGKNVDAQNEAFAQIVQDLGVNISPEQAKGLMDLYRSGKLTQKNLDRINRKNEKTGASTSKRRMDQYGNSSAATDNQSEATTQKQATELYDYGEILRKVNANMSDFNPAIYTATLALAGFTTALLGSTVSFGASSLVRKWAGKKFTTEEGVGVFGRIKNFFSGKGGGGGTPPTGGGGGAVGIRSAIGRWFDPNVRKGGLPNEGPKLNPSAAAEAGGGILGGIGRVLGKIALPVGIGIGAYDVMKAPKDQKGRATGAAAGGILGGLAGGALAGSAIGSVVPVAGTAVGGVIGAGVGLLGAITGGIVGSKIGGGIGSWFDPTSAKAAELDNESGKHKKVNSVKTQTDKENANLKHRTENKKTDNLQYERQNLHIYNAQLTRMAHLLDQARLQNGIIGSMSGLAGGGGGAPTVQGNNTASKIWNFFSSKGLSSSAIAGIMGNLQQESGLNPNAPGGGLAQWTGSRRAALNAYAKKNGLSPNSLEAQLGFMWEEMSSGKYGDMSKMNNMTPSQAAAYFEKNYEKAGKPMLANRQKYANQFYNEFGSSTQWASGNATTASIAANNRMSVNSTINVNVRGDQSVSSQLADNKEMQRTAQTIQQMIYGSLNLYSKEMKMV
ncbi:phage tail tip lysozyme [Collinsella aerofaciens]|nr:phage tail tip lysozyme [Collinsella aerofaciens]MCB5368960.1 phage tail-type lysozyme domain-containing protein [Collinsella aerofaciens]